MRMGCIVKDLFKDAYSPDHYATNSRQNGYDLKTWKLWRTLMLRKFALLLTIALLSAATFSVSHAQDTKTNTVSFNGVSFSFDSSVATSVQISAYPGDPKSVEYPGGPQPKHVTFALYTQKADNDQGGTTPEFENFITVYKHSDFKSYPDYENRFSEISDLLSDSPDLRDFTAPSTGDNNKQLPFLPIIPAGQVIRSQAKYLKTDQFSGYVFVAAYRQDVSPFTSRDFSYFFVGVTPDQKTIVSAELRLDTKLFPKELPSNFDYAAFEKNYVKYMQESTDKMNKAKVTDFTPSLNTVETLVKSINVE
jgi:hypothetical protein